MPIQSFEQLEVWQEAHRLVLAIYRVSSQFPSEERYGITSQMRRAAVSIPANIVEGFKRRSRRDKAHFYNIAQGSLEEVRYYLLLARDLGYLLSAEELGSQSDLTARLLHGLIRSLERADERHQRREDG